MAKDSVDDMIFKGLIFEQNTELFIDFCPFSMEGFLWNETIRF